MHINVEVTSKLWRAIPMRNDAFNPIKPNITDGLTAALKPGIFIRFISNR